MIGSSWGNGMSGRFPTFEERLRLFHGPVVYYAWIAAGRPVSDAEQRLRKLTFPGAVVPKESESDGSQESAAVVCESSPGGAA